MKKILVVGSYVTDLCGRGSALPQENETVMGTSFQTGPGGKGSNQAIAAHRAGGDVTMITRIGDDIFGREMQTFYEAEGMDCAGLIVDPAHETGVGLIEVSERTGANQIMVVPGACMCFSERDEPLIERYMSQADILVCQLEINRDASERILRLGRKHGLYIILNPAPAAALPEELLRLTDLLVPNEVEAAVIAGEPYRADQLREEYLAQCLHRMGAKRVIITLGGQGSYYSDEKEAFHVPIYRAGTAVDTTGAGDSYVGSLAAALAEGREMREAMWFASVSSGIAVTRRGTAPAMARREEIERAIHQQK